MSMDFLLKATGVAMAVAALAATAEAAGSYIIPTIDAADFFLWLAANAIVIAIWLLSSSSRGRNTSAAGHDDAGEAVHDAMDGFYTSSSEYEAFSDAAGAFDAPASSKRLAREARAAARKADRPRVRKKPAAAAQDAAAAEARELYRETRGGGAATAAAEAAVAAKPRPGGVDGGEDEDEDVSMDSLWESIVQRRAARPVAVQKSGTWGNDELPRLQRVAETAATRRGEMRKSVSAVSNSNKAAAEAEVAPPAQTDAAPAAAMRNLGWRTRDVLVSISPDELLRRAESFIRRQHEHLRLQRQESEQRQLQLQRRLHAGGPALIRV